MTNLKQFWTPSVCAKVSYRAILSTFFLFALVGSSHEILGQTSQTKPVARLIGGPADATYHLRSRRISVVDSADVTISAAVAAPSVDEASVIERRTFAAANQVRVKHGLAPLAWDQNLYLMARAHSRQMALTGSFSHQTSEGLGLKDRARASGIRHFKVLAENIAYNQGYDDPGAFAVERWRRVSDGSAEGDGFNVLTQTRHGLMLHNRFDIYIGRSLELYGEWSEGEIALFQQLLEPGMIVIDAGANIGTHTLALARTVGPTGAVLAFEPQRIVFQTLAANVALNSLTNVSCQQRALGEALGLVRVPPLNYAQPNNFGGLPLGEGWTVGETVEVIRIDDLNLATCHLIKIDVEGMELEVLRGAAATIERCQPALYVEIDRADKRDEVLLWLDERGYVVYGHEVPLYNPANFKANSTNVFEDIVSLNALAAPARMAQQIVGLERLAIPGRPTKSPRPRESANRGRPRVRAAKGRGKPAPPKA